MTDSPQQPLESTKESQELEDDALEPFREMPVGTNDPNIVGDVGAFDKPPGTDPVAEDDLTGENQ